ncbi:hypothetical protein QN277_000448 [Acacia crassicarpa]|uniref:RNase H type-1 domain-containing protein n=1 Tax=Acacia crassicarpa TaxID=499986 RepID=A0AAE1TH58_9FABA|nr:hypothetical protein QN277_000448 [Acacia crassicarpa]
MEEVVRGTRWMAPPAEVIKINFDGSFKEGSGVAGVGVVCRNSMGDFIGGLGKAVVASLALKEALLCKSRFQVAEVILETDCEHLYRLIKKNSLEGCEWQCWELLTEIFGLLESLDGVSFCLVARKGNKAADYLAVCAAKRM